MTIVRIEHRIIQNINSVLCSYIIVSILYKKWTTIEVFTRRNRFPNITMVNGPDFRLLLLQIYSSGA